MTASPVKEDRKSGGRIVKIVRFGERFWLRNVRMLDGKLIGQVDNHLLEAPYRKGQIIELTEDEIIQEFP